MITSSRIRENGLKGIVIFLLFTVLSIKSCVGAAQPIKPIQYADIEAWSRLRTLVSQAVRLNMAFPYCEKLMAVSSITRLPSISHDFTPINVEMSFGAYRNRLINEQQKAKH